MLESKLQQLRDEWVKYPEKRAFIERQASSIKAAIARYKPDPEADALFNLAKQVFSSA